MILTVANADRWSKLQFLFVAASVSFVVNMASNQLSDYAIIMHSWEKIGKYSARHDIAKSNKISFICSANGNGGSKLMFPFVAANLSFVDNMASNHHHSLTDAL